MEHAHYQIEASDVVKFQSALRSVRKKLGAVSGENFVDISPTLSKFQDGFLTVLNNPTDESLNEIDWGVIREQLSGCEADENRNNISLDLGYSGYRNSRREPEFLGITHSRTFERTEEEWSKKLLTITTRVTRNCFPDRIPYTDKKRNSLWAGRIIKTNTNEGARVAKTNRGQMLRIHWDNSNCQSPLYAPVATISKWDKDAREGFPDRYSITTYGKQCANDHMVRRKKHARAIFALERLYKKLPGKQKRRDSSIFPRRGKDRVEYPFTFLDKGIYYSLYASAISDLCLRYRSLGNDLSKVCGMLSCVVMSEIPDHYWMVSRELLEDPCAYSEVPFYEYSGLKIGILFAEEIFRRKKHSGKDRPAKSVMYPLKQRHMPAVNQPPTEHQMQKSIASICILSEETRQLYDWNMANTLHYYGKSVQVLVEDSFGSGDLTAQTLLGVGSCLMVFPPSFLDVAEIGLSTRSWKFLSWAFGYKEESAYEETDELLRAASVYLGITVKEVEELCCKLCQSLVPSKACYTDERCKLNFASCVMPVPVGKFGDVVYREMKCYQLRDGQLYKLDCEGTMEVACDLLSDGLFKTVASVPREGFWDRKFRRRKRFHYKRSRGGVRFSPLKDLFISSDTESYKAESSKASKHDDVARYLLGPSFDQVVANFQCRLALNLYQLVWDALGLESRFAKKKFLVYEDCSLPLLRPPCTRIDRAVMSRVGFHCCGILLPDNFNAVSLPAKYSVVSEKTGHTVMASVYFPDASFEMFAYGLFEEKQPFLKAWAASNPRKPIDSGMFDGINEQRMEDNYSWNYSRVTATNDWRQERRWFRTRQCAERYALMEFLFRHKHLFSVLNPQVRSLFFMKNNGTRCEFRDESMFYKRVRVHMTDQVNVYYDSTAHNATKLRIPCLIAVKYPAGGSCYYFCNDGGQRISGAFLRRSVCKGRQAGHGKTLFEFTCIVGHVSGPERSRRYRSSSVNLLIKWRSNQTTEEPMNVVLEDCPWEVLAYAKANDLVGKRGWSRVRKVFDASADQKRASGSTLESLRRKRTIR